MPPSALGITGRFFITKPWAEALGRATRQEFMEAVRIMDAFIGRPGVFLPRVILVDSMGNHLGTTNRTWLPTFEKSRKARSPIPQSRRKNWKMRTGDHDCSGSPLMIRKAEGSSENRKGVCPRDSPSASAYRSGTDSI